MSNNQSDVFLHLFNDRLHLDEHRFETQVLNIIFNLSSKHEMPNFKTLFVYPKTCLSSNMLNGKKCFSQSQTRGSNVKMLA